MPWSLANFLSSVNEHSNIHGQKQQSGIRHRTMVLHLPLRRRRRREGGGGGGVEGEEQIHTQYSMVHCEHL